MISKLIAWTIPVILISCDGPCIKQAQFLLPISISPQKDIYSVGDTIWVELISPYTLTDQITGETVHVGKYAFETGMFIIELLDTNWVNGSNKMEYVESIGNLGIAGFSFPEIVPFFSNDDENKLNHWRFGIIPIVSGGNYVLIFAKRNPFGWSGTVDLENEKCDYHVGKTTYIANDGNIDYQFYADQYPQFRETGSTGDIAKNHRDYGAFFFTVQ